MTPLATKGVRGYAAGVKEHPTTHESTIHRAAPDDARFLDQRGDGLVGFSDGHVTPAGLIETNAVTSVPSPGCPQCPICTIRRSFGGERLA